MALGLVELESRRATRAAHPRQVAVAREVVGEEELLVLVAATVAQEGHDERRNAAAAYESRDHVGLIDHRRRALDELVGGAARHLADALEPGAHAVRVYARHPAHVEPARAEQRLEERQIGALVDGPGELPGARLLARGARAEAIGCGFRVAQFMASLLQTVANLLARRHALL